MSQGKAVEDEKPHLPPSAQQKRKPLNHAEAAPSTGHLAVKKATKKTIHCPVEGTAGDSRALLTG